MARPSARRTTTPSMPCRARSAQGTPGLGLRPAFFPPPDWPPPGGLRPHWPSATCGSCCWARADGRGAAAMGGGGTGPDRTGRDRIGSDRIGSDRTRRGRSIGQSIPEGVRCGPPRASAGRPFPLPAAEETAGAGYQVLHKAEKSIPKLERTLGSLLKMKESVSLEDGNPSGLEEVREDYVKRHFSTHSTASALEAVSESDSTIWYLIQCEKQTMEEDGKPEFIQSPGTSSPDLVEFERYLYFYKHTVDLLIEHEIVCSEEVPLPEVSTAVSHLWQELSEERRDSILQYCSQRDFLEDPKAACQEPACTEGSVRDSQGNSEEASGSSVSTPEEVMFEDAFDVAAGFLNRSETQGMSIQSSAFASYTSENPEYHHRLYLQITDFLKSLFFANTQFCQEEDLAFDYETVMLRCTETFDDEDF
ncbi:LOW QUALITY PROTEIN: stimulated by retinoic acid gene 8 protein homolog [Alca torda]